MSAIPGCPDHSTLEELITRFEELLRIKDTVRLASALEEQNSIFHTAQRLLAIETRALDFLVRKEAEIEMYRRRYYDGKLPPAVYQEEPLRYPPSTKAELDTYIKQDPVFNEIHLIANEARRRVKYLEDVLWRIKERGNEIRTIIDWRKFVEAGL